MKTGSPSKYIEKTVPASSGSLAGEASPVRQAGEVAGQGFLEGHQYPFIAGSGMYMMSASSESVYNRDVSLIKMIPLTDEEKEQLRKDLDMFFHPKMDPLDMNKELRLKAEEDLNENPNTLKDNIQKLKDLIQGEPNLEGRIDDTFLCAFLRGKKHDVEMAFQCYKKAYEFKAKYPDFYSYLYGEQFRPLVDQTHFGSLPGIDKKGRKILVIIPGNINLNVPISDTFKMATGYTELMMSDVHLQVTGMVVIMDLGTLSIMNQARVVTPTMAWHLTMLAQDKIPLRIKTVHIINQPFYFSALYAVFKPFLKKKLRKRLVLHGNDWQSLHNHIEPEHLPKEYGGSRPSFKGHLTNAIIELNEHKFKEWRQFRYNMKK